MMELPILPNHSIDQINVSQSKAEATLDWAPGVPNVHLFRENDQFFIFLTDRSRLFRISGTDASELHDAIEDRDMAKVSNCLARNGIREENGLEIPEAVPVLSASLAVAQKCNLGCLYCYAQEGEFGGTPKGMSLDIAKQTVDALFANAREKQTVHIAFMGGEPLLNRRVVEDATRYAIHKSRCTGVHVKFAITTNGTMLKPQDGEFFESNAFAVTVSLDGVGQQHDSLRPYKGGRGSYNDVIHNVTPILNMQRRMQVSARVTVTPQNCDLPSVLETLVDMGFHSVGFSPMLRSPTGHGEMTAHDLSEMLTQMTVCGDRFQQELFEGRRYPFSNLVSALKEIHTGTHRPYPCGAGAGYVGVSSTGDWFSCHRFVEDFSTFMGSSSSGVDITKQQRWLEERHVDRQSPCKDCWARYLCGGGCHHEVINRGRHACDYIRGWLDYCLRTYVRVRRWSPEYFGMRNLTSPRG